MRPTENDDGDQHIFHRRLSLAARSIGTTTTIVVFHGCGLPARTLIEVGGDHRLADPEPLATMLRACETIR